MERSGGCELSDRTHSVGEITAGELIERVNKIILLCLDNETTIEQLESAHSLQEVGADSLDLVELQVMLEHEFGFEDETDGVCQISTLRDVYTWVSQNLLRVMKVQARNDE